MKNKLLNGIIVSLAVIVTLLNLAGAIQKSFFYNLDDLPAGEFLFSALSTDSEKTLRIYRVNIETLGQAVRGELVTVNDGKQTVRNIYWQVGEDNAIVSWIDGNTVQINGDVVDINGEGYDSRRQIIIPDAPAINKGLK